MKKHTKRVILKKKSKHIKDSVKIVQQTIKTKTVFPLSPRVKHLEGGGGGGVK